MSRKHRKPSRITANIIAKRTHDTLQRELSTSEFDRLVINHNISRYGSGYASIVSGQARRRLPTNRLFKRAIEDSNNARNNATYARKLMRSR